MSIIGNMVGGSAPLKTVILTDESGNEVATGVVVDQEVVFTATDNDVREGMVYASDSGVSTGTKDIPIYRTRAGMELIPPNSDFSISMPKYNGYDYTVFQCMISLADLDNIDNSVSTSMIALNDGIYEVNSTNKIANISKNTSMQSIDFNITNDSDDHYVVHYFTYREEE